MDADLGGLLALVENQEAAECNDNRLVTQEAELCSLERSDELL